MRSLITGKDVDESSLSHIKWNCIIILFLSLNIVEKVFMESRVEIFGHIYEDYAIIKKGNNRRYLVIIQI